MKTVAVIGGGVSGLTVARQLKDKYRVTIYEKEDRCGGLIRCKRVEGSLYHLCGGHVFNTKRSDVSDFFWSIFNKEKDFVKADRNSVVYFGESQIIPYPIENHAYLFSPSILKRFVDDLISISKDNATPTNFEEFLKKRFGETLYEMYFGPYNEKLWKCNLKEVSLDWLEGKLPMPSVQEIIYNNILQVKEKEFVHSTFYYEKQGGSQFLADVMAKGLDVRNNACVTSLEYKSGKWYVNNFVYDFVVFCGNIKDLPQILKGIPLHSFFEKIQDLKYHGTTSVFCEINDNPYSWIYLPNKDWMSHRIICTGNFSPTNNSDGKMTASIEFTDEINKEGILDNLRKMPFKPKYLDHYYSRYTYPIQDGNTRKMVREFKDLMARYGLFMTGRFADWEYYNMDVAMGAAIDMCKNHELI